MAVNHLVKISNVSLGLEIANTDDRYWGTVTMKHALVMDLNNAAVWTLNELGIERFNTLPNRWVSKLRRSIRPSLSCGGSVEGLSLLELTSAYLPGKRRKVHPTFAFEQVTDTNNQNVLAKQQGTPDKSYHLNRPICSRICSTYYKLRQYHELDVTSLPPT